MIGQLQKFEKIGLVRQKKGHFIFPPKIQILAETLNILYLGANGNFFKVLMVSHPPNTPKS